jgi:hypothetical protein
MKSMRFRVAIFLALICGIVGLIYVAGRKAHAPEPAVASNTPSAPVSRSTFRKTENASAAALTDLAGPAPPHNTSNIFQRIAAGEVDLQLTSEQIAEYLRRYGTNVETLLATQQRDYIRLAAELFPNDPRVQYAVITRDIFPADQREWLDRFKQSAPDNPVANYLSAREYFRAGDRERGLQELADAGTKSRFDDYTLERWQSAEEAQLSAGRSVVEAKMAAGSSLLLPQLAMYKNLSQEIQKVQKEYLSSGDTASAETLARLGHTLAQQLMQGENSRPLINQLVGAAIDRIVLSPLSLDSQPAFLNGSIQQQIDELTAFRTDVRTLMPEFNGMLARGDEAEIISYFDRLKLQGEYKAMLWLKNRNHPR